MILLFSKVLYSLYLNSATISIFFYFFLLLFSFLKFTKIYSSFPFFLLFSIVIFVFELLILILNKSYNSKLDLKFIDHIYLLIGIVCSSLFYYKLNLSLALNKIIFSLAIILFFTGFYLAIWNKGYLEGPKIVSYKNFVFSILAIIVHSKLLKSNKIKSLKNEPLFWFNIGFLFINLLYLIIVPLFNYAIDISDDLAFGIGIFKNLIDPITCVIWCIGIYKLNKYGSKPISSLWP